MINILDDLPLKSLAILIIIRGVRETPQGTPLLELQILFFMRYASSSCISFTCVSHLKSVAQLIKTLTAQHVHSKTSWHFFGLEVTSKQYTALCEKMHRKLD